MLARTVVLVAAIVSLVAAFGGYVAPLGGGILTDGIFYATVGLGNPSQGNFKLQVDTGSSDLLVFATGCTGCSSGVLVYDKSKSQGATYVPCHGSRFDCQAAKCSGNSCGFYDAYGDGSHVGGLVVADQISIDNMVANTTFGAVNDASSDFEPKPADGIWGVAYRPLSSWSGDNSFDDWAAANQYADKFGLCLTPNNPVVVWGDDFQDTFFVWVPVVQQLYYNVDLSAIYVGPTPVQYSNSPQGTIIDSGTTLAYIPDSALKGMYNIMTQMCKQGSVLTGVCGHSFTASIFSTCVPMTVSELSAFPDINFGLGDSISAVAVNMTVPPAAYILPFKTNCYQIAFQSGSNQEPTILGDIVMQSSYVAFDRVRNEIGIAGAVHCPSPSK